MIDPLNNSVELIHQIKKPYKNGVISDLIKSGHRNPCFFVLQNWLVRSKYFNFHRTQSYAFDAIQEALDAGHPLPKEERYFGSILKVFSFSLFPSSSAIKRTEKWLNQWLDNNQNSVSDAIAWSVFRLAASLNSLPLLKRSIDLVGGDDNLKHLMMENRVCAHEILSQSLKRPEQQKIWDYLWGLSQQTDWIIDRRLHDHHPKHMLLNAIADQNYYAIDCLLNNATLFPGGLKDDEYIHEECWHVLLDKKNLNNGSTQTLDIEVPKLTKIIQYLFNHGLKIKKGVLGLSCSLPQEEACLELYELILSQDTALPLNDVEKSKFPLLNAVIENNRVMINRLLDRGDDINQFDITKPFAHKGVLNYAAWSDQLDLFCFLRSKGAILTTEDELILSKEVGPVVKTQLDKEKAFKQYEELKRQRGVSNTQKNSGRRL